MKKAFTLSEVLIAFVVIGVIAATTVPLLFNKYTKDILTSQLKVGYSILNSGMKKAMADACVTDFTLTDVYEKCLISNAGNSNSLKERCAPAIGKVFRNMKTLSEADLQEEGDTTDTITDTETCKSLVGKTNKWWYLNDNSKCHGQRNMVFEFGNGMRADITIKDYGYAAGTIILDINGGQGPNTWGRDAFYFYILKDGRVVPYLGREFANAVAAYYGNDSYKTSQYFESGDYCSSTTTQVGTACAARVIENSWKMDY